MYSYNGKLDWFQLAVNEAVTIIFPAKIALNEPVSVFWKWTKLASATTKWIHIHSTVINSIKLESDGKFRVGFTAEDGGYFLFNCLVSPDYKTLKLTMSNTDDDAVEQAAPMNLHYKDHFHMPTCNIFAGTINWHQYAKDELVVIVFPEGLNYYGVAKATPVLLYYQWTQTPTGNRKKVNVTINETLDESNMDDDDGDFMGEFADSDDQNFTFVFVGNKKSKGLTLTMMDSNQKKDKKGDMKLLAADFRTTGNKKVSSSWLLDYPSAYSRLSTTGLNLPLQHWH